METKKNILITGATSGIGKVAALELAKQGHTIIIHGRNPEKTEAACQEISHVAPDTSVDIVIADLTKRADTLALAETIKSRYDTLDVLVNNAGGVMNKQRELTVDGWEKTMALNVLAPFMLSALLYPIMEKSSDARIINTASTAHRMAKPDMDDLMYGRKYNALKAYGDAKLHLILMGQEFEQRQRERRSNVVMNAFHPGVVATNFAGESDSFYRFFFKTFRRFLTTPEKGADTMIYLASDPQASELNGEYLVKRKIAKVHLPRTTNWSLGMLWEEWERYTGVKFL